MRFLDDRLNRPAAIMAAHFRDDAEGALIVAALGNLHVGVVPGRHALARRVRIVDVGRQVHAEDRLFVEGHRDGGAGGARLPGHEAREAFDLSSSVDRVDLRNLLLQLIAIALGHAAGDDQLAAGNLLFELGHLQNGVDRFLLGAIDKGAGVHDLHVGLRRVGGNLVPVLLGHAEHDLGVDEILGTA